MRPSASRVAPVPSAVVPLLADARVQATFAAALALLLGLLLGAGEAAAGWSTSPG